MLDIQRIADLVEKAKLQLYKAYEENYKKEIQEAIRDMSEDDTTINMSGIEVHKTKRIQISEGKLYNCFDVIYDGTVVFAHAYNIPACHSKEDLRCVHRHRSTDELRSKVCLISDGSNETAEYIAGMSRTDLLKSIRIGKVI